MKPLRVVPGRGPVGARLYVGLADGRSLAWYDRDTGRVSLLADGRREDVLAALAPYVTGPVTVGPPPVPTPADLVRLALHPDDDLAPNRPGEALHTALADTPPTRRLRPDPQRERLAALQAVGDELDTLERAGWRVLHSVPLPGQAHLDHLLIGPAGPFSVHTVPCRRRFRADAPAAAIHLRRAVRDAERASFVLAAAVRPVLAVAGTSRIDGLPSFDDVLLLSEGDARTVLARLGGVLKPADIESLYASARDRHTWLRA
ncbi:NERD domain-containing protein [Streptomyces sp. CA-294286]|uniref:NERD domain-containing protein n=1 Tax=Streptomyces sp. CA-294286 TaxID=3240070 RepID=UPI003D89D6D5